MGGMRCRNKEIAGSDAVKNLIKSQIYLILTGMQELQKNEHYKVVKVEFPAGTNTSRHIATSDAFVIVESGDALLVYEGETHELGSGSYESIPAFEPHLLKVISDFKAYIILANDAEINYAVQ